MKSQLLLFCLYKVVVFKIFNLFTMSLTQFVNEINVYNGLDDGNVPGYRVKVEIHFFFNEI